MSTIEQLRISGKLPSPKGVALAVMKVSQRHDATLNDIARVVQTDPALSGRLLRAANTAAQPGRAVASINEAVLRLGMTTVRELAMSFSLVDQYSADQSADFDYPAFWSHSLFMAVASQELGRMVRVGNPEDLFACGLLAQIGRLAMVSVYPAEYVSILERQVAGVSLVELEREALGLDHNELTATIMSDCGIPKALVEPVFYHETPDASEFSEGSRPYQLTHLFFQARRMADLGLAPDLQRHSGISELILLGGKIGLNTEELGQVFDRVVQQWHDWADLLKVPAGQLPAFTTMTMANVSRPGQEAGMANRRVLLVEDEPTSRITTEELLSNQLGCTVFTSENGRDALALALEVMPQIVITDWAMPIMDGLEFCRALRATEWGQSMYVIMLTGVETEERIIEAFEAGVDDYVTKPVNHRALNARMRAALHYVKLLEAWEHDRGQLKQFAAELAISNRRSEHAAMTDLLTGLPNRRAGMQALDQAWNSANRNNHPLAVLMIDVDHFKSINDNHGHAVGDQVLREVGRAIQAAARKDESVSRIGGEEFLLVCHNADTQAAVLAGERLRKMVKSLTLVCFGVDIRISVSVGVASRGTAMKEAEDMVRAADKALYAAKSTGRDRVCLFA